MIVGHSLLSASQYIQHCAPHICFNHHLTLLVRRLSDPESIKGQQRQKTVHERFLQRTQTGLPKLKSVVRLDSYALFRSYLKLMFTADGLSRIGAVQDALKILCFVSGVSRLLMIEEVLTNRRVVVELPELIIGKAQHLSPEGDTEKTL